MTCDSANSEVWLSQTFFAIQQQVEDLLTIRGVGDWLGARKPLDAPVCVGIDKLALQESNRYRQWLLGNLATRYLKSRLPELFLVAGRQWIYASEHPIDADDPLSGCCELIDLDRPEFAWLTLLLDMCDAVAADQPGPVSMSAVQASRFLSIAQEIDDKWVSY